jgi:hypothetical protein
MRVIHGKNRGIPCPLVATLVAYLVLDRFDAEGWILGAVGAVFVFIWILWLTELAQRDLVDIFEELDRKTDKPKQSRPES